MKCNPIGCLYSDRKERKFGTYPISEEGHYKKMGGGHLKKNFRRFAPNLCPPFISKTMPAPLDADLFLISERKILSKKLYEMLKNWKIKFGKMKWWLIKAMKEESKITCKSTSWNDD
jgi:hypothetical protein